MHARAAGEHDAPPERVLLRVRAHGRRLVWSSLFVIVAAAAAGFWGGSFSDPWLNVAVWLGFAGVCVLSFATWLSWLMRCTVVTSQRVVLRRGVLVQHRSVVPFARIREVRSRRSLVQRVFGTGNVLLVTGADSPIVLRDVPGSETVCDALRELIDLNYEQQQQQQQQQSALNPVLPISGGAATTVVAGQGSNVQTQQGRAGYSEGRFTRARRAPRNGVQ